MKTCTRCGATKPLGDFHRRAKARDGRNAACKECICAERRAYTAQHPDRLAEQRRTYMRDPKKREAHIARARAWRAANPERMLAYREEYEETNRERRKAFKRSAWPRYKARADAWVAANRDKERAKNSRFRERNRDLLAEAQRRRRVDRLGLRVEDVDLESLWTGICPLCGGEMDGRLTWPHPLSKSVDHIMPLALGGTHERHNLQWAHLRCNVSKGARLIEEVV